MNKIQRKNLIESIIVKLNQKETIISLEMIVLKYNKKTTETLTVSGMSYALKNLGINLKKINEENYKKYKEIKLLEDLNSIPNTNRYSLDKLHKKINFPKSKYELKKLLEDLDIRTKETKKSYLDKIKEELDYHNLTLRELYKLSGCKNKFSSFKSKIYSTDIMFKDRKTINTNNRKTED